MSRYACHDRKPFKQSLIAQAGYFMDGYQRIAKMVSVPFVMSEACQYTKTELGQADEKCDGCKWREPKNSTTPL